MSMKIGRLGDAELEIMQAIWGTGRPVRSSEVQAQLKERRSWPLSTVMTVLGRLVNKGFLTCEKDGGGNLYRPLITRQAYMTAENRRFLRRLYGNSFTRLVVSMYDGETIGEEELQQLRQLLDELEKKA